MRLQPLRYAAKARSEPQNIWQAILTWQPQSLRMFVCFSHRRFNFYPGACLLEPGEAELSKSRTSCLVRPTAIEARRSQDVVLGKTVAVYLSPIQYALRCAMTLGVEELARCAK